MCSVFHLLLEMQNQVELKELGSRSGICHPTGFHPLFFPDILLNFGKVTYFCVFYPTCIYSGNDNTIAVKSWKVRLGRFGR